MEEGKLTIRIKGGKFSGPGPVFADVHLDRTQVLKTGKGGGFSADWDETVVKHIKGRFREMIFTVYSAESSKALGSTKFGMDKVVKEGLDGEFGLPDPAGMNVGEVNIHVEFEEGDVDKFGLHESRLHI
mmetsp:Transcript_10819/g.33177  ORF Transcript_10819/g.33177 Transcript_10819/m.33177 type:complete len:129 (+) Transcript_10819:719-1105(+)